VVNELALAKVPVPLDVHCTDKYLVAPSIPIATDGEYFYDIIESWKLSKAGINKLSKKYNVIVTIDSNPIILKYKYK